MNMPIWWAKSYASNQLRRSIISCVQCPMFTQLKEPMDCWFGSATVKNRNTLQIWFNIKNLHVNSKYAIRRWKGRCFTIQQAPVTTTTTTCTKTRGKKCSIAFLEICWAALVARLLSVVSYERPLATIHSNFVTLSFALGNFDNFCILSIETTRATPA